MAVEPTLPGGSDPAGIPRRPPTPARSPGDVHGAQRADPRRAARSPHRTALQGLRVPTVNDVTCAASAADLIAAFEGRPADQVFIEVRYGIHTASLFLRRYSPIQGAHHRRLSGNPDQGITRIECRILLGISRGLSNHDIGLHLDIDTSKRARSATPRFDGLRQSIPVSVQP